MAAAFAQSPRIFYSDLESGPNQGGENGGGAYVSIYGNNFGASQGSSKVNIGGGLATNYPVWTNTKITFQLGVAATSGAIQVSTVSGTSNSLPFTVRAGNIYFVSTSGSDSNSGLFASPWKTLVKARNAIQGGDIVYAMDGVSQAADDGEGWSADLTLRQQWCSASGFPRAFVAYPNAIATIGNPNDTRQSMNGLRATDASASGGACKGNWIFAGLQFRGNNPVAIGGGSNWRFVGNDISCPSATGTGGVACFETSQATNLKLFGNNVHDAGASNASALFHGVYFSTDTNHIEMGWNTVANVRGCRGIQIHSSPLQGGGSSDPTGHNQFDISIHDNVIHDTQCDGIVLATVDPSQGAVQLYDNIIYNAGEGPNNPERTGNWACIFAPGTTNTGPVGGGVIEVFNNTLYNCGSFTSPPYTGANGALGMDSTNPNLRMRIRNNIIHAPSGIPYFESGNNGRIFGSNNLFFGNGSGPSNSNVTATISADPVFVNAAGYDFHLQAGSPAQAAGVNSGLVTDFDGALRGSSFDLGAYQASGSAQGSSVLTLSTNSLTTSGSVTVINSGSANAAFVATTAQSWITITPVSGIIVAGGTQALSISVNSIGLPPGLNTGTISIWGGDNGMQTITVQVGVANPTLVSLVNGASYQNTAISPGEVISAFGSGFGPAVGVGATFANGSAPTVLGGTRLLIGGVAAPLLYAQAGQINAVVPQSVQGKTSVQVVAEYQGFPSAAISLPIAVTSPGVFTLDFSGQGQAVVVNSNDTINGPGTPAARSSTISIYLTGLGLTNSTFTDGQLAGANSASTIRPTVTIGGAIAAVNYAGFAPGSVAGVDRIDAIVPAGSETGVVPLVVTSNGVTAATVSIVVQ